MKKRILFFLLLLQFSAFATSDRYVIAIHGLMGDANTMRSIERQFRGCPIHVNLWHYPSTEGTICAHAQALFALIQQVAKERPEQPIDFITHSVGALILRQALNIEGVPNEAKIGRAVLLAPPNQGSRLARESKGLLPVHWALGTKICCELMNYDACRIQAIGPFPSEMEVLVIAGYKGNNLLFKEPNDGFVAVSETALETPFFFESFKVNHSALLTHPKVIASARCFLLQGSGKKPAEEKSHRTKETESKPKV
jgi:hypothetical protein